MGKAIKTYAKQADLSYYGLCIALSAVSVAALFSVAQYGGLDLGGLFGNLRPALTQILASVCGVAAMVAVSLLDYHRLVECKALHIACWALVLLSFVPFIGYEPAGTGSRSWIAMPFGMSFQPTEIAKISFTLTFAGHLAKVRERLNRPKTLLGLLCHLAAPVLLVHLQGDDGTALVFAAIGGVMLVAAGLNRWVVTGIAAAGVMAAPFVWNYAMSAYQRQRIVGLFNPAGYADGIMYQQLQGYTAISGGGWFGRGLFGAQHTYVPRAENDFIFSWFAESCGFVGCVLLLGMLFALVAKTLFTAGAAPDDTGSFVCTGVFAAVAFQSVVNLGMNLLLLPVVGVTLPFVSAGGTSVLMLYLSMGLVVGVGRRRRMATCGELGPRTFSGRKF